MQPRQGDSLCNLILAAVVIILLPVLGLNGYYYVQEGYVGVCWMNGALRETITDPGVHLKVPYLERCESVQVTLQTDKVTGIPCGTSGGVMITFDSVEVVNRLQRQHVRETIKNYTVDYDRIWIFDKIHHFMNQFCSVHTLQEVYIDLFDKVDDMLVEALQADCNRWAPGIEIVSVRITKPRLPAEIAKNYETVEREKTQLSIANATQRRVAIETETEQRKAMIVAEATHKRAMLEAEATQQRALIQAETRHRERMALAETERAEAVAEAEKVAQVSRIAMEMQIAEQEAAKRIALIEADARAQEIRTLAEAREFEAIRIGVGERTRLTPAYIQLEWARAFANSTKIYFGTSIPTIMMDMQRYISDSDASPKMP